MQDRKERLKELIRQLHDGADPGQAKEQFKQVLDGVTPPEIARVEEELIREGMPQEEIHRLCDIHLAVFRESLERGEQLAPPGHPIHILMEEHKAILGLAGQLVCVAQEMRDTPAIEAQMAQLEEVKGNLQASEHHYVREENVLFPYLEKHGVTQPPAIMWMEHDRIRSVEKSLYALVDSAESTPWQDFVRGLTQNAIALNELLNDHFQKENRVLFPTALQQLSQEEWVDARQQFDEVGYCPFTPKEATVPFGEPVQVQEVTSARGEVTFPTGHFSPVELDALLNALPVDITFVDADDKVRYFNEARERIFPRTRAALGRQVQLCHPQKSVHLVNRILEDFRSGRRDLAEFWIQMEPPDGERMFVHIRYFAVRGPDGKYLGSLEVVQNLSPLRALEGERRLLDEKE